MMTPTLEKLNRIAQGLVPWSVCQVELAKVAEIDGGRPGIRQFGLVAGLLPLSERRASPAANCARNLRNGSSYCTPSSRCVA
jgi:hypothetical protein